MEAHLANETKHCLARGRGAADTVVHLIISGDCLRAAGVDPGRLVATGPGAPAAAAGERRGGGARADFSAAAQTRFHGSGACSAWEPVFAAYVPAGALASVLMPTQPADRPPVFAAAAGGGEDRDGLFVSLPVALPEGGGAFFDPFTRAALRLELPDGELVDLLFAYEELLPAGTRYEADVPRMAALCWQFVHYARRHAGLPPAAAVAAEHMEACLTEGGRAPPLPPGGRVRPARLLAEGGFDDPAAVARLDDSDQEVLALIRRAAEVVAARHPVRRARAPIGGPRAVAAGLLQGARAAAGAGGGGRGAPALPPDAAAALLPAPAAPPAAGPGPGLGAVARALAGDTLVATAAARRARTLAEWFDAGHCALLGGDTPCDAWRRRPLSLVARRHYETGEGFVVVAYEQSAGWGGRRAPGAARPESVAGELARACERAGAAHPRELPAAARAELARRHPFLAAPLGEGGEPPLVAFDAGAEVQLAERFRAACAGALVRALARACEARAGLPQRFHYDVREAQRGCLEDVARRVPGFLRALAGALGALSAREFLNSALCAAAVAHLSAAAAGGRGFLPYHRACFPLLAGGERALLFDYFSFGGEVVKVSRAPLAATTAQEPGRRLGSIRLLDAGAKSGRAPACGSYAPGESYAYACLGFSRRLQCTVVFPGGFALEADVAAHLDWPARLREAVLGRLGRPLPAPPGAPAP
ncbi:DNA packaging tegument protein UL17 [Cervid alphaherpesvirus 1]|uniref:DNA packaging tegument protein UL17 n=1 Tax=Cervid alphaherpesvirus 1 TaxID=79891 RepID=A0A455JL53_9ALPH|nr:DNA packaging tegument protein UL17 [Cervid alphaherpesvirus 1]AVT50693.1 DNA packaging tegument protein UL17 [Cervid alphaherpesvirus 1]